MNKICAVYKITNTITGDFYIGSSKDVKRRWVEHKCQSVWNDNLNKQLYQDMKKYGVDKFVFQMLAEVEVEQLKKTEQKFIEALNPTYNQMNANGWDFERHKESKKEYDNQLCLFNGETLTLHALRTRFKRAGIPHPVIEAKKYLLQ